MTSSSLTGESDCTRGRRETKESAEGNFIEFRTCRNLSIASGGALGYSKRSAEAQVYTRELGI